MVLAVEGSPGNAAHFEQIVVVTATGVEILTRGVTARPWAD
jgi:methionine aminopeptidase